MASIRPRNRLSLERGDDGRVVAPDAESGWTPCSPDAEALAAEGLPAELAALFGRDEGRLVIEFGDGFEVSAYDHIGWLGAGSDPDLARALHTCAELVVRHVADREGRQPIAVCMSDFMKTGRLGPVEIGTSQRELVARVGPPEDMMTEPRAPCDHLQARIWKYHEIEFYFEDAEHDGEDDVPGAGRRVSQISRSALMYYVEPQDSRALEIEFDFLVEGQRPNYLQVEAQARELGLEWEYLEAFGEVILALSSGVYFMFETSWDEDGDEIVWTLGERDSWSLDSQIVYIGHNPGYLAMVRARTFAS